MGEGRLTFQWIQCCQRPLWRWKRNNAPIKCVPLYQYFMLIGPDQILFSRVVITLHFWMYIICVLLPL
ncbi:hypothetical protein O181_062013 [Austropuccinia psidii MF-1]|uniref:Uncharacterized protein n=1 Tax=Austropuccinia psidii MF-1 TaxID=1389203 RepID=A0A9Q3ENY7_9BASI|nr:hypothetical protein [Austropuccinia psidii MF-1]